MRYEEFYNEELRKRKKIQKILKLLPIVLGIVGILLASFLVLFFTSGSVTQYEILNVTYGEKINSMPQAFLGNAEYEFLVNGEYQSEAPTLPGTYSYRVKTIGMFGKVAYSSDYSFTIEKKKATVYTVENEISYGDNPHADVLLIGNDKLESYTIEYESLVMAKTKAWVKKDSIVIVDENGNKVNDYYDIEIEKRDIEFTSVPFVVKLIHQEKTYDGTPLTSSTYEIYQVDDEGNQIKVESLYNGDTLELEIEGSQTIAGTSDNIIKSFKIKNKDNEEVLNYRIDVINSTLTINKKDIELYTEADPITFDGVEHTYNEIKTNEEITDTLSAKDSVTVFLAKDYEYKLTPVFTHPTLGDVTESYNYTLNPGTITVSKASIKIKPEDIVNKEYDGQKTREGTVKLLEGDTLGSQIEIKVTAESIKEDSKISISSKKAMIGLIDVTESFDWSFEEATITYINRSIKIKPKDDQKSYDGIIYETTKYEITDGSLAKGDNLTITANATDVELLEHDITILSYKIMNGSIDVTERYNVTKDVGILTIEKRDITITPMNQTAIYGDSFSMDYTLTGSLVLGHEITPSYNYTDNINDNTIEISSYTIMDGTEDVSGYYNVTTKTGILTITKRSITVACMNKSRTYDATKLTFDASDIYLKSGTLAYSDTIDFVIPADEITNVGKVDSNLTSANVILTSSKDDIYEYYDITFENGSLTITKRTMYFISGSKTEEYDLNKATKDNPLVLTCSDYDSYGLASGDEVSITDVQITGSLDHIGQAANTVEKVVIKNGSENVTDNYEIIIYEGTLTYIERSV